VADDAVLSDPVWCSLTGPHRERALVSRSEDDGRVLAVRYRPELSAFGAIPDLADDACWDALAAITPVGGRVALATTSPVPATGPRGWERLPGLTALQMVVDQVGSEPVSDELIELGPADAEDMVGLAYLTRPGPFGTESVSFGGYLGVRDGRSLVAMAGRRFHPDGWIEISGVCTHPDARGRGLSRVLVDEVARRVRAEGARPFLHVREDNLPAVRLYVSMGFVSVRALEVLMLTRTA
jgi:ribosomal protein S18 acetylase RimI-like enzyme